MSILSIMSLCLKAVPFSNPLEKPSFNILVDNNKHWLKSELKNLLR